MSQRGLRQQPCVKVIYFCCRTSSLHGLDQVYQHMPLRKLIFKTSLPIFPKFPSTISPFLHKNPVFLPFSLLPHPCRIPASFLPPSLESAISTTPFASLLLSAINAGLFLLFPFSFPFSPSLPSRSLYKPHLYLYIGIPPLVVRAGYLHIRRPRVKEYLLLCRCRRQEFIINIPIYFRYIIGS